MELVVFSVMLLPVLLLFRPLPLPLPPLPGREEPEDGREDGRDDGREEDEATGAAAAAADKEAPATAAADEAAAAAAEPLLMTRWPTFAPVLAPYHQQSLMVLRASSKSSLGSEEKRCAKIDKGSPTSHEAHRFSAWCATMRIGGM
jgi:hypothetical protein